MFSAWKFVTSFSTSGLSTTVNPNGRNASAIASIVAGIGWRVPRRIGRPGAVTSTRSAVSRASSSEPARPARRVANASSRLSRTVFAIEPTFGRSSGGSAPIPRRIAVRPPFLPRTSISSASSAAMSGAASIPERVSPERVSRSAESWPRSTGGSGAPGRLDDLAEGAFVADGDVREDLAIDRDVRGLEALDEPAVGQAAGAGCRVDADDPQAAHLALALLPVAGGVGHRMQERLARRLDQPGLGALSTLGGVEEALMPAVRRDAALDSCHSGACSCPLEVRQQAPDLLGVLGADGRQAGIATGASRRLDLEVVAPPRVHSDDLAAATGADALLGRLVALHLRHADSLLLCGLRDRRLGFR